MSCFEAARNLVRLCGAALIALAIGSAAAAEDAGPPPKSKSQLVTIPTRPGVTDDFVIVRPVDKAPVAIVILFVGGDGTMDLKARGPDWIGGNFLLRIRNRLAGHRMLVAVPDAPSDKLAGYGRTFRSSNEHAADIAAVIAYMRAQADLPVWLIGTSNGTISAVNGALLEKGGPDGLVLTSSITRRSKLTTQTVLDFPLKNIRVPTLVVAHQRDSCVVSPAEGASEIKSRLTAAPKVEVKLFTAAETGHGDPCEAYAAHGYAGIELDVVNFISDWIEATAPLTK